MRRWYSRHEGWVWLALTVLSVALLVGLYSGDGDLEPRYSCGAFDLPEC